VSTVDRSDHRSGQIPARAGFVVPRTVGPAVVRNLVRRRLRHLLRDRLTGLPAGSLLVVRVLPGGGQRPYAELARDLDAALAAVVRSPAASPGPVSSTRLSSGWRSSGRAPKAQPSHQTAPSSVSPPAQVTR
jgi:ribonuclease P protein component